MISNKLIRANFGDFMGFLKGYKIGIIGYGNQGRSQALNLRDSGLEIIVGNIKDDFYELAIKDGFEVLDINNVANLADILVFLIPDNVQPIIFEHEIKNNLAEGKTIVFASGFNYYYKLIQVPKYVDVVMVAPRMIGSSVRRLYVEDKGFPSLLAVGQNYTGKAETKMLAIADAIGTFKQGGFGVISSFKEETLLDLLSEQTWAGALIYLFFAYYDVALELGASPEAIITELYASGELSEIAEAMEKEGLIKQLKHHSIVSQYGHLIKGRLLIDKTMKEKMKVIAKEIINGTFLDEFLKESKNNFRSLKQAYEKVLNHNLVKEEEKLYKKIGRI
jgi:ketol-acid reductoisomerase